VTPAQLRHATAELQLIHQRLELIFWTIRTTLALIVLVALTVAFVVSLCQGASVDPAHMAIGAGITGASARGKHLVALRRRFDRLKTPL
jgi:hypothetical protein